MPALLNYIMNSSEILNELMQKIGWNFHNEDYLRTALTHSSLKNERMINKSDDYERQEFLGDAVLEFVVSDYLFKNRPEMREGGMTKLRSALVCEPTLAFCARAIDLSSYILLGHGEDMLGTRYRDSIVSDVFEAVIGAIYLDGGIEPAKEFIFRFVLDDIEHKVNFTDSKTILQTRVQKAGGILEYQLKSESGPDNAKNFVIAAYIDGKEMASAGGRSKKAAEQQAAYDTLKMMNEDERD